MIIIMIIAVPWASTSITVINRFQRAVLRVTVDQEWVNVRILHYGRVK